MPLLTTGAGKYPAASVATTTWNPADKDANIGLTGGNLTATKTGDGASVVRSVASRSSGLYYYEITFSVFTGSFSGVGIANGTASLSAFMGSDVNACIWLSDGRVYVNNSNFTNIQSWAQGDTLCTSFDATNKLIWFRTNGGNWNNSGAANPATGTGGIDLAANGLAAGPYLASIQTWLDTNASTANFGATTYAQTAPSGFGNW